MGQTTWAPPIRTNELLGEQAFSLLLTINYTHHSFKFHSFILQRIVGGWVVGDAGTWDTVICEVCGPITSGHFTRLMHALDSMEAVQLKMVAQTFI